MLLRAGVGNAVLATLLALAAAIASCFLSRRPAVRHALWLLVLLKLVTPPITVVPLGWARLPAVEDSRVLVIAPPEAPDRDSVMVADAGETFGESPSQLPTRPSWRSVAVAVW